MSGSVVEGASGHRPAGVDGPGDHPRASPSVCPTLSIPWNSVQLTPQIRLRGDHLPSFLLSQTNNTPGLTIVTEIEIRAFGLRN